MVVPSSRLARRGRGERAGELEEGQEHRTFAHVLNRPTPRSFSRAFRPIVGDNCRNGHCHEARLAIRTRRLRTYERARRDKRRRNCDEREGP